MHIVQDYNIPCNGHRSRQLKQNYLIMQPPILFSVIIPVYNYAHCVTRAIDSVLCQSGDDYELIVINDGSSDDSEKVVQELQTKHSALFTYYTQKNMGLAATRNRGIDVSVGRYLIFLDADDALTEYALPTLRRVIELQPDVKLIIGGHLAVSERDNSKRQRYHPPGPSRTDALSRVAAYLLDKTLTIANGACAMHRDVFSLYRYPEDFRNSEDLSVFSYVLANFSVTTIDHPIARIYKHSDSLRHNITHANAIGSKIVDEIFAPSRLPGPLQTLKNKFMVQRYLSLSRTFFIAGDYDSCRKYFIYALKKDWKVLFRWSYSRKVILSFFKKIKS